LLRHTITSKKKKNTILLFWYNIILVHKCTVVGLLQW
jgi:hypothetical protein